AAAAPTSARSTFGKSRTRKLGARSAELGARHTSRAPSCELRAPAFWRCHMIRSVGLVAVLSLGLTGAGRAQEGKYSVKPVKAPPPTDLKESFRSLLSDKAVALLDDKGGTVGQVWFRMEVPAKATPEQIKSGLTYREIEESTVLGALKLDRQY